MNYLRHNMKAIFSIMMVLMVGFVPSSVSAKEDGVPLQVAIVGDVMAQGLSQAIKRLQEADLQGDIVFYNYAKGSSGFVRDDYYDWNKQLPVVLETNKFDYILVFLGSNDRQSIRLKGKNYKPKTPIWREEYTYRIDRFLDKIQEFEVNVIWLGQPISRGKSFSNDMALFNEIYRQHVLSHDGTYFDVWNLFADEDGKYNSSGPDVSGQIKKLRADNGIHFTRSGYDKMAFQIIELIRNIEGGDGDFDDNDIGEVVDFEKYDLTETIGDDIIFVGRKQDGQGVAQADSAASENVFQNKTTALKNAPSSAAQKLQSEAEANLPLWKKVLEKGYIIDSEFGRSDDFSWPRN